MRKLTIALGLIEQRDKYYLQLRDNDPVKGTAGLIGCFGGKVEPGEKVVVAVAREINEETNLGTSPGDWKYIGRVDVISDHNLELIKMRGELYRITVAADVTIEAREGELVVIKKTQARTILDKMTPGTRACFEQLIDKEQ